jgi:hypothetical protein
MKKIIMTEDWETIEVPDDSSLFVLIFKQGSNTAGYIKCYDVDDTVVLTEYANLVDQYANVKFEEPTSILVVKLPATGQVKAMLEEAVYVGDEANETKLEIINHLLGRADCEYIEEKVLMSLEEAKKKKKKKKTPKVTYLMGFPWLNDHRFNHAFGSCDCGKDAAEDANGNMGSDSDSASGGSSDGSLGGESAGGEGGAMGESLITEAMTPLQKMQALENGTRGFNAAAASDLKLMDNLIICAQNNLQKAAIIIIKEIQLRANRGVWTLGPIPGLNMPNTPSAPQPNSTQATNTGATGPTGPTGAPGATKLLVIEPNDFNPADFALLENNQDNPSFIVGTVSNYPDPLHWAIVLIVMSASGGFTKLTDALKTWILKKIDKDTFKQIISGIKNTPAIVNRVTDICNKDVSEGVTKMTNLTEAKRYVKRYYIRPQNVFASNKAEILQRLAEVEADGANCSVYSLKALEDHDDVHLLQPKDIIYYYDEGVLYDKNHVPVLDYDLNVKHEEERPKISPDATSDERFKDVYQDRMTDRTVVEELNEDFYVDFDDVNVYGIKLKEGKEAEYTCCICGDDFEGFGNNPAPYKESGKCCDACNRKFVIPSRLAELSDEDSNEDD